MITPEQFGQLLPLASAWTEAQEQTILRNGVGLSSVGLADAVNIGIASPEKVRLLKVDSIPVPTHPALQAAAVATGLISPSTAGMTVRYGIFIRADCWSDRKLIFHELVHTLQYERMGGIPQFLKQYLFECITFGYPDAPLEQEAIVTTAKKCV